VINLSQSPVIDSGSKYSKNTAVYYTNLQSFDTLNAFISRSPWLKQSYAHTRKNGDVDTIKLLDAYKTVYADSVSAFVAGHDCFKLFSSADRYMSHVGLNNTPAWFAVRHLLFQCHEEFLQRDQEGKLRHEFRDPYHRLSSQDASD
jgi:nicotinic acid mononucleotide adenylyltransferase